MTKPYRWLARYYDELFSATRKPVDAAREQRIGPLLRNIESACDLACGTGETAIGFARRGIRTWAVDLSPTMVRLTREKARAAKLPIRVRQADMRSFRLPEPVDLIVCECDAVNHVPRPADLGRVARAACRALRPGGHFYFDVNNSLGFKRYWKGDFWIESPNTCMVMRSRHSEQADRAWSDIECFIRDGASWRRHRERVEEVCWTRAEVLDALHSAGFDSVRAWDGAAFFDDPVVTRGCRTVYLARKSPTGR